MNDVIDDLERSVRGRMLRSEPLERYTTYRTGGEAEALIEPADEEDLVTVVRHTRSRGIPLTVLGAGSNVIAPDSGIDGVVLVMRGSPGVIRLLAGKRISADAGVMLDELVDAAGEKGLAGLEELAGIPGTVGGALFMNAGTRNAEISDHLSRLTVLTCSGRRRVLISNELSFGYRRGSLTDSGWLLVSADFLLRSGDPGALSERADEIRNSRKIKYPWDIPSAGSVFKHPPGRNAGHLIEEAGCKGMRSGGAAVSELHANFIVNDGGAKSADIMDLIDRVRKRVFERFGIILELEQIPLPHSKG
jgi:UDP-N-acetylmuramate dehydrogenase